MDTFNSGAWRKATRGEIYIGGSWRSFTRAEAYIGATWRQVLSFSRPLTLSVPAGVSGSRNTAKPSGGSVVTDAATATPSGGVAPYSYVWQIISGSSSIFSPNNATTAFSTYVPSDTIVSATARVTCTDARGQQATGTVSIEYTNLSNGGDF